MSENFTKCFSLVMGGIAALVVCGSILTTDIDFFGVLLIIGFMIAVSVLICLLYEIVWDVIRRQRANKRFKGQIDYYEIYSARKKKEEEDSK